MFKELIKIANNLDSLGYFKEADLIDSILKKSMLPGSFDFPGGHSLDPKERESYESFKETHFPEDVKPEGTPFIRPPLKDDPYLMPLPYEAFREQVIEPIKVFLNKSVDYLIKEEDLPYYEHKRGEVPRIMETAARNNINRAIHRTLDGYVERLARHIAMFYEPEEKRSSILKRSPESPPFSHHETRLRALERMKISPDTLETIISQVIKNIDPSSLILDVLKDNLIEKYIKIRSEEEGLETSTPMPMTEEGYLE